MEESSSAKRRRLLGGPATPRRKKKNQSTDVVPRKRQQPPRPRVAVEQRPVMSIDETAAYLNLSRESAYAMVRNGALPVVEFGRRKLIVRPLLDEMLLARANEKWRKG